MSEKISDRYVPAPAARPVVVTPVPDGSPPAAPGTMPDWAKPMSDDIKRIKIDVGTLRARTTKLNDRVKTLEGYHKEPPTGSAAS